MTDPAKVQAKINQLNLVTPGQTWVTYDGYHALIKLELTQQGVNFQGNSGLGVKAFMNSITGEIKLFPYSIFEYDTTARPS